MKLRVGCLTFVFLSVVLSASAQVTGSGTTFFVPRWTGSSTLGNSNIFQTSSMVGIGTTSPAATLDVTGFAPTVFRVTGGNSAGIQLTSGRGNPARCRGIPGDGVQCISGGPGGAIQITAASGGSSLCLSGQCGKAGNGGSITLQPGGAGAGTGALAGVAGQIILAPSFGNVGIGTISPGATLDIGAGRTTLADHWTTRSSRRFKTNIQPLQGALQKVEQLQGVSYERKVDGEQEIGVVAEEVDRIVPEVVSRDPETHEVQGVDYSRLSALLIEAVKSQQAELQLQQAEIQQLKALIEQLRSNPMGQ